MIRLPNGAKLDRLVLWVIGLLVAPIPDIAFYALYKAGDERTSDLDDNLAVMRAIDRLTRDGLVMFDDVDGYCLTPIPGHEQ